MPSSMTGKAFVAKHGGIFASWLQDNTVECACEELRFGPDEKLQRGQTIDADTVIHCRRCYVPLGIRDVRLLSRTAHRSTAPTPCPSQPTLAARHPPPLPAHHHRKQQQQQRRQHHHHHQ